MEGLPLLLLATICTFQCLPISVAGQFECSSNAGKNHLVSVSITSKRNESGVWNTWFTASQNTSLLPQHIDLDLTRTFIECQGNHFVKIQGNLKEITLKNANRSFFFHKRCSAHAALTNNGRTLQKVKLDGQGAALTTRPLLDDEIFTVRLDKKDTKLDHATGIGVTTHSPDTLEMPNHMYYLKSGTWMFYHTHLYQNSAVLYHDYLKTNLKDVKVGQHVGVMRSKTGTLHFFLDGVDQGPAASNIPDTVYGVFELYGNTLQGTIIDP